MSSTSAIKGNFIPNEVPVYRAIQYTGPESFPSVQEFFRSIGFDYDDVRAFRSSAGAIKIPAVDVTLYDETEDTFIVLPTQVIIATKSPGDPTTNIIDVLEAETFCKTVTSVEDAL